MRRSDDQYDNGRLVAGFDYINQAWVEDGVYVDCGHPQPGEWMPLVNKVFTGCICYGREHEGEAPPQGQRYRVGYRRHITVTTQDSLVKEWLLYSEGYLDGQELDKLIARSKQAVDYV